MADYGYCPSGRLFEAAACGCPVLSDTWDGLEKFYVPGEEILIARTPEDSVAAMELSDAEIKRIAGAARDRTMAEHTSEKRAIDFEDAVEDALAEMRGRSGAQKSWHPA
jgi:spore maturation protein CgeB